MSVGGAMPGVPLADLSRPPPGFQAADTIPTAPYYDLPAGLMVSLVKFDESKFDARACFCCNVAFRCENTG